METRAEFDASNSARQLLARASGAVSASVPGVKAHGQRPTGALNLGELRADMFCRLTGKLSETELSIAGAQGLKPKPMPILEGGWLEDGERQAFVLAAQLHIGK